MPPRRLAARVSSRVPDAARIAVEKESRSHACGVGSPSSRDAETGVMPRDQRRRAEEDEGRAAVDAACPRRSEGPGRRARRLHPAGPAPAHRPGHRPDRTRAGALRAHPRQRVPVVRRTRQEPPRRAVPRGLAPRPGAGDRARRPHRRTEMADPDPRRRAGSTGRRRITRRRHHRLGRRASRPRRADQRRRDARQRAPQADRTAAPLDQAAAGRTARCPSALSTPARSARPTRRRTARPSGLRCSSRSPARHTGG